MQIQEVINHIAAGDSVAAKEGIENVLSAKAFDALQARKQEMAATLFGGQEQEHEEVTDDEEAYAEDVEHDGEQEQLDELSKATLGSYAHKASSAMVANALHSGYVRGSDTGHNLAVGKRGKQKDNSKLASKSHTEMKKREAGLGKAISRLAK